MGVKKYLWTLVVATFNMTVTVVFTLLVVWHTVGKHRMQFHPNTIPTLWKALADIFICAVLHEIDFYYLHRYANNINEHCRMLSLG